MEYQQEEMMGSIRLKRARLFTLSVLAIGGLFAALAVACGGTEIVTERVVETVIVEKQLPGQTVTEKVVETVLVEKEVEGKTVTVVETVVVEKEVTRIEKVVETVVVEREVEGKTVMVVETVIVEKPVTRIEKVIETVVVEKAVTVVEKVVQVQTVVVAPTPVPPPTPAPTPEGGPQGTFRYATENIIPPLFVPALGGVGHEQDYASWGMVEFLVYADHNEEYDPSISIATSWDLAEDSSKVRFTLRRGIPFHQGWGELTADDVVWSMNNAIREGSTFWGVGGLQIWMDRWEKIDDYTVDMYFKTSNASWLQSLSNLSTHQPWIYPKKAIDELGEDRANVTPLGTGPFENVIYRTGDIVVVEAFDGGNHWRAKPAAQRMEVVEIREPLARNAAFIAGEVDIIAVLNKDIASLKERVPGSYEQPARGSGFTHIMVYTGNYWKGEEPCDSQLEGSWTLGEKIVYPRAGFKPDAEHPWIGDPSGNGNSMESALKVRQAMSMGIDRQTLVDTVFGGLGLATGSYIGFQPYDSEWKDEWDVEYDLEGAKALLAEAGYPNGFEFEFYVPPDHIVMNPEAGEAVAQMWRQLGLNVNVDRSAYAATRPRHFNGVDDIVWYAASSIGNLDKEKIVLLGRALTFHGAEVPCEIQDLAASVDDETDYDKRVAINVQVEDYVSEQRLIFPIATVTDHFMVGPRIKAWTPHRIVGRYFTNPETVQVQN
jgi:ABC-type transport system substrate-binding protein